MHILVLRSHILYTWFIDKSFEIPLCSQYNIQKAITLLVNEQEHENLQIRVSSGYDPLNFCHKILAAIWGYIKHFQLYLHIHKVGRNFNLIIYWISWFRWDTHEQLKENSQMCKMVQLKAIPTLWTGYIKRNS